MSDITNLETARGRIIEFLENAGCCWRCSLRFAKERGSKYYRKIQDELPEKVAKPNPCVACLGILQKESFESRIDEIVRQINSSGYDAQSFTCTVSLPIIVLVREHSLWLSLLKEFPGVYSLETKDDFVTTLKDVWKYIYADDIEKGTGKTYDSSNGALFQIQISFVFEDDEKECHPLVDMCPEKFKHRYQQTRVYRGVVFTRNAVQSALNSVKPETFEKYICVPPPIPETVVSCGSVTCFHSPIFIAGRYMKFSRTLCQTPWVIDGEKRMETSIQELLFDLILPFFEAKDGKFSSSGREDVDVRTLGKGRPFVIELADAKRTLRNKGEIKDLQERINSALSVLAVRDLQLVSKENLSILKEGEEEKTKAYSALCITIDGKPLTSEELAKLSGVEDLVLQQKTPLRVLHRRPLAVRERVVHNLEAQPIEGLPSYFILKLKTQAGTYIKEFVHGDFGRTVPNVCSMLGREVDIVALDVDRVDLNWPPYLTE